jgi:hypothetical protein
MLRMLNFYLSMQRRYLIIVNLTHGLLSKASHSNSPAAPLLTECTLPSIAVPWPRDDRRQAYLYATQASTGA